MLLGVSLGCHIYDLVLCELFSRSVYSDDGVQQFFQCSTFPVLLMIFWIYVIYVFIFVIFIWDVMMLSRYLVVDMFILGLLDLECSIFALVTMVYR